MISGEQPEPNSTADHPAAPPLKPSGARVAAERVWPALARLRRITAPTLPHGSPELLLQELLRRLRAEYQADTATVLLLDQARAELVVRASDGLQHEVDRQVHVPLGVGVAGSVAASGRPLVIDDLSATEVVSPLLREHICSMLVVPVKSGDEVVGVLHIGSHARRQFSPGDVELLEDVADRVASLLALIRLYDGERAAREALAVREAELRRLNAELDQRADEERALRRLAQAISRAAHVQEIMHQIAEGALAVSGATGVYVEQMADANAQVRVVAASGESTPAVGTLVPYPGSLTEEIIVRREAVFLTRMQGIGAAMAPYLDVHCHGCSVLVAPLVSDERVLGALVLLRRGEEAEFEFGVINRVRTLADLASIALQRVVALAESEHRRAEAEAAVRSRDEVLSIVSHDLRNPVATVSMSASLLRDPEIHLDDRQRRVQLDVIARSAQRMNRLIQDLLDVARIEGGRFTISCRCEDPASLVSEAWDAFRSVAAEREQTITCDAEPGVRYVYVDRDRISQVLSNYLNNALKFTPRGGCITLGLRATSEGGALFSVADNGPGISPDELPKIFSRFWQAKRTAHLGSGLGLSIVHGIAEAHRGRVWVESIPGSGSTFFLELPPAAECA